MQVAILGGGLAGMSAAVALAHEGYAVTLVEKRNGLGGRAGSQLDGKSGLYIDNCQHVLMPCCTNLLHFYDRIGVRDKIRFHSQIPFIESGGRVSTLRSSVLPAPLHCSPSFLSIPFLSLGEKFKIATALASVLRIDDSSPAMNQIALEWLRLHGQTPRSIQNFWEPIFISALNEELSRCSLRYVVKVLKDAFLSNRKGWWLGIPTVPLSRLYGEPVRLYLEARGGQVLLQTTVRHLKAHHDRVAELTIQDGTTISPDFVVSALPWKPSGELLPEGALTREQAAGIAALDPSPIIGVHLWFDRIITNLEFASLPGKQVQWFFNKTRTFETGGGTYLQLVTSASRSWMDLGKSQILELALKDLREVLPSSEGAQIVRAHVLKEPMATYSPTPESEDQRPECTTRFANLYLAGDWLRTGWPATMEGAVRSGYTAAEAILKAEGRPIAPRPSDLPRSALSRLISK